MKKLVMLLALAVAFSLSGFAQTSSTGSTSGGTSSTEKTEKTTKKTSKKSSTEAGEAGEKAAGKSHTVTGCLKSDAQPVTLTNGKYKSGVQVDTSADTTDDFAKHNGHKVQLTGSWEGTGADKKFKATAMKHISETCTAGGKASAAGEKGEKKGKTKKGAADTSKTPS